jgi:hypothetical protein
MTDSWEPSEVHMLGWAGHVPEGMFSEGRACLITRAFGYAVQVAFSLSTPLNSPGSYSLCRAGAELPAAAQEARNRVA